MRTDVIALVVLIALSLAGAWWSANRHATPDVPEPSGTATTAAPIIDDSGYLIPPGDYQRIVCSSSIAAMVVPELVNSNRVVMVSQWWAENSNYRFRLDHAPIINKSHGIESILAHNPDLVIVNGLDQKRERLARLRETGIQVLDLGKMLGWKTLSQNIETLGKVLQRPQRAQALVNRLQRRLQQTAIHIPVEERHSAMWLAVYGGKMFGGTQGSSYHDMLRFAGLHDVVAGTVNSSWPSFTMEELLRYDPDYLVTGSKDMAAAIRTLPGLKNMRAVKRNNIVIMPKGTDSTGPELVDAAEFLCDAVYGPPPVIEQATLPKPTPDNQNSPSEE